MNSEKNELLLVTDRVENCFNFHRQVAKCSVYACRLLVVEERLAGFVADAYKDCGIYQVLEGCKLGPRACERGLILAFCLVIGVAIGGEDGDRLHPAALHHRPGLNDRSSTGNRRGRVGACRAACARELEAVDILNKFGRARRTRV